MYFRGMKAKVKINEQKARITRNFLGKKSWGERELALQNTETYYKVKY